MQQFIIKALKKILAGDLIDLKNFKARKTKTHKTYDDAVNEKMAIKLGIREKDPLRSKYHLGKRLKNVRLLVEEYNKDPDEYTDEYEAALTYERQRLLDEYYLNYG